MSILRAAAGVVFLGLLASADPLSAQTAPGPDTRLQPVTDPVHVEAILSRFQTQIDRLGAARIDHCGPVVQLVAHDASGRDQTVGAICSLMANGKILSALMCQNSRGEEFSLSLSAVPDMEAMRRFLDDNCYPKG